MRNMRNTRLQTCALFVLALALAMTGAALVTPPITAAQQAPDRIKIGQAIPLSGPDATIGEHHKVAARLAVKEVNDDGGLFLQQFNRKIPVELIQYDDESNPAVSVRMTERLVNSDHVVAMICGYKTDIGMQQSTAINRLKVPCITGGWASTAIFNRGYRYIFSTSAAVVSWSRSTMDFLKVQIDAGKLPKPTRIALAVETTAHGKDFRDGVVDRSRRHDGYFVMALDENFEPQRADFSSLLSKLAAARADVFLVDAGFSDFVTMQRQIVQRRLKFKAISYGARGAESEAREALGPATDYLLVNGLWSPALPYKSSRDFVAKWTAFVKEPKPQLYSALAYEASRVLLAAIQKTGTLDQEAIRDTIARWDERGTLIPGGRTFFSPSGIIENPLMVVQVMPPDGKPAIVWPEDAREKPPVVPMP